MKIGTSGIPTPTFWDWLEIAHDIGFRWFELPADAGYFHCPGGEFFLVNGSRSIFEPRTLVGSFYFPREYADEKGHPTKELLEVCETYGMKPNAIYGRNDFVRTERSELKNEYAKIRELCDLTVDMNCDVLRLHGGTATKEVIEAIGKKTCEEMIIEGFKNVIQFAEDTGVSLAIENHLFLTNDGDLLLRVLEAVDSDNLGVNIDTGNFLWYGWSPETIKRFFKQLAPYAKHTHLKDGFRRKGCYPGHIEETGQELIDFAPLGEGEVPIKFLLDLLRNSGYKGSYNIQYETVRWEKHLHGAYEGVRRSYNYLISSL